MHFSLVVTFTFRLVTMVLGSGTDEVAHKSSLAADT
jgi:hypothetical protein